MEQGSIDCTKPALAVSRSHIEIEWQGHDRVPLSQSSSIIIFSVLTLSMYLERMNEAVLSDRHRVRQIGLEKTLPSSYHENLSSDAQIMSSLRRRKGTAHTIDSSSRQSCRHWVRVERPHLDLICGVSKVG